MTYRSCFTKEEGCDQDKVIEVDVDVILGVVRPAAVEEVAVEIDETRRSSGAVAASNVLNFLLLVTLTVLAPCLLVWFYRFRV